MKIWFLEKTPSLSLKREKTWGRWKESKLSVLRPWDARLHGRCRYHNRQSSLIPNSKAKTEFPTSCRKHPPSFPLVRTAQKGEYIRQRDNTTGSHLYMEGRLIPKEQDGEHCLPDLDRVGAQERAFDLCRGKWTEEQLPYRNKTGHQ